MLYTLYGIDSKETRTNVNCSSTSQHQEGTILSINTVINDRLTCKIPKSNGRAFLFIVSFTNESILFDLKCANV